ncbi:MAG: nucleotidyltransferase domain-containing protein [Candidatus Woesearchaeota archaeon]|jgi:tRNA nucleotidyltransferase (CCA-adding enzyme)
MGQITYRDVILNSIKPTKKEQERVLLIVENTKDLILNSLKKNKINAKVEPGGSFAKNTWLKGDFDCDMFVRFDKKYEKDDISELLSKNLPFQDVLRVHGSRDYFQFELEGINFEIVPTIYEKNPEDAKNSTDISPLHITWVKEREKKNEKLCDEIRLTKKFFKGQQVYGAESYINGFSGHVIDILVAHYGSFEKLIEAASNWKEKELIDTEKIFKSQKDALTKLNESKTFSPLIVVDPILSTRNAAAALGLDKFRKLIESAKKFIETQDVNMFEKQEFDPTLIFVPKESKLILIRVEQKKGSKDIVGCKVMKLYEHIKKQLTLNNFDLSDSGFEFTYRKQAHIYFVVSDEVLTETVLRIGPPIKEKEHVKRFIDVNPDAFEKEGKWQAYVKREFRVPKKLIEYLLKSDFAKEKIEGYKILKG